MEEEAAVELNISLPALLTQRVAAHGAEIVLRKKDRGIWKATTWSALDDNVRAVGQGLLAAGFGKGDVGAIVSDTRPEAVYADLAILGAGGASVVIDTDDDGDRVAHILRSSGARFVFVENEEQLDKILALRADCPGLGRIVIFDMKGLRDFNDPQCLSLEAFIVSGQGDRTWDSAVASVAADDTAIIRFQAGRLSVGEPLSHAAIMRMLADAQSTFSLQSGDERLAVLSMADSTERIFGLYLSLNNRVISNYLENPETAIENLQQLQPTVFGANTEAWERLHARITQAAALATPVQRWLYGWAISAGRLGGTMGALANTFVLHAVRRELGLNRLRLAYVGDGAVSAEVDGWARALGIEIQTVNT